MPKLQAAVPAGAPPNALLRVRLPDGNEVNVRVPEGLKPGDEFIFEVSSIGEITSSSSTASAAGTKNSSKKGDKSSKQSKNPKKKKSHMNDGSSSSNRGGGNGGGGGGGDHSSHQHSNHGSGGGAAPGFVTGFFNMYNQVYDILAQNNTSAQPKELSSFTRQGSSSGRGGGSQRSKHGTHEIHNPSSTSHHHHPSSLRSSSSSSHQQQQQSQLSSFRYASSLQMAPLGFLDRELVNGKDFMTALAVGIFIGMSVVLGFLGGVLYVTPIAKEDR